MTRPEYAAFQAVVETMARGSDTDGRDDSWRQKPSRYHLLKAIRHATTHLMLVEGVTAADGEHHLKNALTRLAMCLSQEAS